MGDGPLALCSVHQRQAHAIDNDEKSSAVAQVYGMLCSCGFEPARDKHAIVNGHATRMIMRVDVDQQVTITQAERCQVSAMVHRLKQRVRSCKNTTEVYQSLTSALGNIGRIERLHPSNAEQLRIRARGVQSNLAGQPFSTTLQTQPGPSAPMPSDSSPKGLGRTQGWREHRSSRVTRS
jgi:hypothetical protein